MKSPSTKLLLVAAAVAATAIGIPVAWASHTFTDVPTGSPHHADIDYIEDLGITGGCAPGLFCPADPVRRDQMATFLARTIKHLTQYGVAAVDVTRGGSTTAFGVYSTVLGSPVIDTTGGTFRFTCDAAQAPCSVAVKAAALSDKTGTALFLPRILIERTGTPTAGVQPTLYCEYADGSGGPGGLTALTKQPKAVLPSFEAVEVNIGGTADCGLAGPGGDVASIDVPEGFYNVEASFSFQEGT
jgi:hypothetical protein